MNFNEISFRVRYGETDQMGVVYHGNYAQYLELGRVEWLRSLGVSYRQMENDGIMLPVLSMQLDFLKPGFYDDLLTVRTVLKEKPSVRIRFGYEIFNASADLLVKAQTVLVFMDRNSRRPIRCPQWLSDKIVME